MDRPVQRLPFEASFDEILRNPDVFVDSVFSCLQSEFLVLPKGAGFVDYAIFESGYEALKAATSNFTNFAEEAVYPVVLVTPISIVVLRAMLGFSPPEWAYVTSQRTDIDVPQGFARTLDRDVRMAPLLPLRASGDKATRIKALLRTAAELLAEGADVVEPDKIHRLDKADTKSGLVGLQNLAGMGVPYAMLLYERFLGRPFAGHRDSVSELVGDILESAIEDVLSQAKISYRKTKRAEKIEGFDQAPDFIIPSEFNPKVVIEAKLTEDDGTARDKVTRIQHLASISLEGQPPDKPRFEVLACIAGRGFGVRREDMKKMLLATRGKVFTLKTIDRMVVCTRLKEFAKR
jgi:hypothetical protein